MLTLFLLACTTDKDSGDPQLHESTDSTASVDSEESTRPQDSPNESTPIDSPPSDTGTIPPTDAQLACLALVSAANAFLGALDSTQLDTVSFDFDDGERQEWTNLPVANVPRGGLSFEEMTDDQKALAYALLEASLSTQGYQQAVDIISVDQWAADNGDTKLGEKYYHFAVFGTPTADAPWAWQFDGHHLVYNFTVFCEDVVMTPSLLGISPATGTEGSIDGLRAMGEETDDALALLWSLNTDQQAQAVLSLEDAPDLFVGPGKDGMFPPQEGLPASELDATQQALLLALIEDWVYDADDSWAALRMMEIEAELDTLTFAWMGSLDGTEAFYYRIHSDSVFIELDHVSGPDHIHAVYRSPTDDYGADLLAAHYARYPHPWSAR